MSCTVILNFSPDFSGEGKLSEEDAKTIRVSLLGLIKYYVFKEITFDELNQILCFVVTVKDENMVCFFFSFCMFYMRI